MTSPGLGNVLQQYSCRCQNITIHAYDASTGSTSNPEPDYHRVFVGEEGVHIKHHYLTLRIRDRAKESENSPNKLLQHLALSCLACKTLTYRVAQEISRGSEAREGPVIPTEDWVEQETLLSKSGWVEVFVGSNGCLVGRHAIEQHSKTLHRSGTFSIGVISYPNTPRSPSIESKSLSEGPWPRASTPDSAKSVSPPSPLLPPLPPLLPPPPFTPSHPVFLYLSALATATSTKLRQQAEDETRSFVRAKLDALEKEQVRLRKEVEGIWGAYRDGWKEVLSRANEERRRSLPHKSDGSIPTSSARGGIPMSIRDFSPVVRYPQMNTLPHALAHSVPLPSTSLLSASLLHTGSRFPAPTTQETNVSGNVQYSGSYANSSSVVSSRMNGTHSSTSSSSYSNVHGDVQFPGAFKRNMDTSVDITSSVAWVQGEEEMRRRFEDGKGGEPRERARKRTSKNLGIGAIETILARPTEDVTPALKHEAHPDLKSKSLSSNSSTGDPTSQVQSETHRSSPGHQTQPREMGLSSSTSKVKRRVTFDVQPEVTVVNRITAKQHSEPAAEVELFDLDDMSWEGANKESDAQPSSKIVRPQPIARNPSYKLRHYDGASAVSPSHPGSLPNTRTIPRQQPANGNANWIGGSTRRSVGLADALPLLSSSVPAGDRVLTQRSLENEQEPADTLRIPLLSTENTPTSQTVVTSDREDGQPPLSIPNMIMGSAEAELKHLLAASAPSHRHAWKEGGRAWEMFHQRVRDKKKKIKGAITEEGSDSTSSSLDDVSDTASGENLTNGIWRSPSQYPSSLPVQIRPLAQHHPRLEPKTSLTDKQGVLVPPLHVKNLRLKSATAIRRAIYDERDRTRSIDPGPTLDFNEQDEVEDEEASHDADNGDRGRRHALSILQARSIIPEAGMWRSMTS